MKSVYLAYSKNHEVRQMATSGGFVKEALAYLVSVGYKAVITRMNDRDIETIITSDFNDIYDVHSNSCYIENPDYFDFLKDVDPYQNYVAVCLPCQVNRLPKWFVKICLICNHSPGVGYMNKIAVDGQDIIFRTGDSYNSYTVIDGVKKPFKFSEDFIPDKCKKCSQVGENADFICGDTWGLNEPNKTLVLCNSDISEKMLSLIRNIEIKKIPESDFIKSQGKHFERKMNKK